MNRRFAPIAVCLLCTGLFAASCGKSADQASSPDANSSPSVAESAKTAVKKALEAKPLVVPADTVAGGCFGSNDQLEDHSFGERFSATVRNAGRSRRQGGHSKARAQRETVKRRKLPDAFKVVRCCHWR